MKYTRGVRHTVSRMSLRTPARESCALEPAYEGKVRVAVSVSTIRHLSLEERRAQGLEARGQVDPSSHEGWTRETGVIRWGGWRSRMRLVCRSWCRCVMGG